MRQEYFLAMAPRGDKRVCDFVKDPMAALQPTSLLAFFFNTLIRVLQRACCLLKIEWHVEADSFFFFG